MKNLPNIRLSQQKYGGLMVIVTVLAVFFVAMLSIGFNHGWVAVWAKLAVPNPPYIWADLRLMLDPIPCYERGINITASICHPHHAIYNYPILWLQLFSALGIKPADFDTVGLGWMVIFMCAGVWLFRRTNPAEGLIACFALLSPPVFFAVQRGNCEEIVFPLIMMACLINDSKTAAMRPLLLLIAAFLKLFPVAVLMMFFLIAPSRRERIMLGLSIGLFIVYCLCKLDEIALIRQVTQRGTHSSFGVNILPELLRFSPGFHNTVMHNRVKIQQLLTLFGCITTGLLYYWKRPEAKALSHSLGNTADARCFLASATVFVFVFFVMGNNWLYRLVYLILCLPQAMCWMKSDQKNLRVFGQALTLLCLLALWTDNFFEIAGEIINWIVCLILSTVLLAKVIQAAEEQFHIKLRIFQ